MSLSLRCFHLRILWGEECAVAGVKGGEGMGGGLCVCEEEWDGTGKVGYKPAVTVCVLSVYF
jgi:hypothetical protein